jgi:hypothetical protein
MWYGKGIRYHEGDPTPVAVGYSQVHARRPLPQTLPRHRFPTPGTRRGTWYVNTVLKQAHPEGAPVFPGSSRLGIEPKTPVWLERECCLLVLDSVTFTPRWIRQPEAEWWCVCDFVTVCSRTFTGLSTFEPPVTNVFFGTLAFSLRLVPSRPAADAPLTHRGSSATLPSAFLPSHGPISLTSPPCSDLPYVHLQQQLNYRQLK